MTAYDDQGKKRGLRVKAVKKYKNGGAKESLKQGISDTISQRHIKKPAKMPPGTSLSGDRTAKESRKMSYPTVGIPPVKLPFMVLWLYSLTEPDKG